jgi:mRNA interferase RelE/StbE
MAELTPLIPVGRRRIQAAVELLSTEPRPSGTKKLVGGKGEWRVRTGDYSIVYEIHERRLVLLVLVFGDRREVYRSR